MNGHQSPVERLQPGYLLLVARLLPYKNVESVAKAVAEMPGEHLVIVGSGPSADAVRKAAAPAGERIRLIPQVSDEELRWLDRNALVSAAPDDFGLTPVEAAAFGTPTVGLAAAGLLETIVDGVTGILFDEPSVASLQTAIATLRNHTWDKAEIITHARRYSEETFHKRLHALVAEAKANH